MDSRLKEKDDIDSPGSEQFQQRREAVRQQLEEQKRREEQKRQELRIQNVINEFLTLQTSCHNKIDSFVRAFDEISPNLPIQQQDLLQVLLKPYGTLIANPFNEKPSGNILEDITHIVTVINARNAHFIRILPAISRAAMKMQEFTDLLASVKADPKLKEAMLKGIQSSSWMDVETRIMLPNQRLMQYRLLLTRIEEEVNKSDCTDKPAMLAGLNQALAYILPELKHIDKHREVLGILNDVEKVLDKLAAMEVLADHILPGDQHTGLTCATKIHTAKLCIDSITPKIIKKEGAQQDHLSMLIDLLQGINENAAATLWAEQKAREEAQERERSQAYYLQGYNLLSTAISATLFGRSEEKTELDPREQLPHLMNALQIIVHKLEAARNAYDYLVSRSGGTEPPNLKL